MKFNWLILALIILAGCSRQEKKTTTAEVPSEIPVIKLLARDTSLAHNYVTDIQSIKNVEIRARVQGFIEKILVDEGQYVKKGQLLFQLNDQEYRIALSKAEAGLSSAMTTVKIAEVEMERIRTLVDKKVISKSELDLGMARLNEAKSKVADARATIADANHKLSYIAVRAPFDGIIDRIPLKTGSLVSEGALLTTVSDNQEMYTYFDITENEYLEYKRTVDGKFAQNKVARLILSDGSLYPIEGKIQTHESKFSDNTGSIAFRAKFPNPDHMLKHGASGKIQLVSELQNSILVPQKAVFEIQDKNYVFVMDSKQQVKMKSFVPSMRIAEYFVVDSGLKDGDVIVYEGVQNIRDGVQIKPVFQQEDTKLASK